MWFWRRMLGTYHNAIRCVHLQYKRWINPRHCVNKHTRSVDPWTKHIGVCWLGPAWVSQVPVHVRRTQVHPVLGSNGVTKAVAGTWKLSHLGMSGSTASEEHLHDIRAACLNRLQQQLYTAYSTRHYTFNYISSISQLISDFKRLKTVWAGGWVKQLYQLRVILTVTVIVISTRTCTKLNPLLLFHLF